MLRDQCAQLGELRTVEDRPGHIVTKDVFLRHVIVVLLGKRQTGVTLGI
jgi:hypothetical protein